MCAWLHTPLTVRADKLIRFALLVNWMFVLGDKNYLYVHKSH